MYATKTSLLVPFLFLSAVSASFSGLATFYNADGSVGACGQVVQNSDFEVALNSAQYTSARCGQTIQITSGTKTTNAVIKDECFGCGTNGLDLTEGLFEFFASLETGEIRVTWDFVTV